jgi:nucleotide-binding universal stress UspA family protein
MYGASELRRRNMKMLLATDGSGSSIGAAQFLSRLRCSPDDEITVLYVIPEAHRSGEEESHYADLMSVKKEVAPKILDATINELKDLKAKISTAVAIGHPDKAIIDAALLVRMDMIVMGSRGIKGLKSLFLGSVTRATTINSPVPVLVTGRSPWKTPGPLKVLYATDGSEAALDTGKLLARIPFPEHSEVTIMHVSGSSFADIPERFYLEMADRVKEIAAKITETELKRAEGIINDTRKSLGGTFAKVSDLVNSGDPVGLILNAAEKLEADIIALGGSGMRGVKGMLGSVSRRVLGHATCSVLIGKTRGGAKEH